MRWSDGSVGSIASADADNEQTDKANWEDTMLRIASLALAVVLGASVTIPQPAAADDVVKLTIGQRGFWDTAMAELGTRAGIFKKYGIVLDVVYTSGSGETLQPVISGNVDGGLAVGTLGAIAAYAKGAPIRII